MVTFIAYSFLKLTSTIHLNASFTKIMMFPWQRDAQAQQGGPIRCNAIFRSKHCQKAEILSIMLRAFRSGFYLNILRHSTKIPLATV